MGNEVKPELANKKRVLIAGGVYDKTFAIVRSCIEDKINICGIVAFKKDFEKKDEKFPVPVWFYEQLLNPKFKSTQYHAGYEDCLRSLLADPRTAYFCERYHGIKMHNGIFNQTVQVEVACWNSLAILSESRPDRVIFMNLPHKLITWIFGRCVEFLGIPTYFAVKSSLPWRYWAVKGIDEQDVVDIYKANYASACGNGPSERAIQFVEKKKQSYEIGIPEAQKNKLEKNDGRIWSWKKELYQALSWDPLKLLINIINLKRKYGLFKVYNNLSEPVQLNEPYIVFFLHYQPEATTLPRGLGYTQQWLAVRALHAALPSGCKLVVKEHPSTFLKPIKAVRDNRFYKAMAALPQVILAPLEADPFKLIDSSLAVVTLTGTAGFEAVCRGKPVLILGAAKYKDCPGTFFVSSIAQMARALQQIISAGERPAKEKLYAYLSWVESLSITGLSGDGKDDPGKKNIREIAKIKIWESLIRMEEDPLPVSFGSSNG